MTEAELNDIERIFLSTRVRPQAAADSGVAKTYEAMLLGRYRELFALARLGLWAEEKGIPAHKLIVSNCRPGCAYSEDALAALPAVGAAPGEGGKEG